METCSSHNLWKTAFHKICGKLHFTECLENCFYKICEKLHFTEFWDNVWIFLISAPNLSPSTFLRLMHVRNCSTSFWLSWHLKAWNTASASAFGNFLIFYLDQGKYYHATSGILKNNWSSKNWFLCEFCYKLN